MKLLIDMGHPAHIHLFKNCIRHLKKEDEIKITTRDKEFTLDLLKAYGLEYELRGGIKKSLLSKGFGMLSTDYKLYKTAKKFKPDLLVGVHNPYIAQVGKLIRKPSITFTDTENVGVASKLTFPFTDTICTPSCFREGLNPEKHVRYNGYHELAYLHPNYFQPDSLVLDDLNLSKDDRFIVLRFISWAASHDVGLRGVQETSDLIEQLEPYGRIFITSEGKLSPDMEKYRITCSPEKIHSLLYYSQLYIGEGGTMATEAAILGTPSIHIESTSSGVATGEFTGNFLELKDKYDLLHFYPDQEQALEKAIEILENKNSKKEWQKKREKLLKDKIDVTAWMIDFIERYPKSFYDYKNSVVENGINAR